MDLAYYSLQMLTESLTASFLFIFSLGLNLITGTDSGNTVKVVIFIRLFSLINVTDVAH